MRLRLKYTLPLVQLCLALVLLRWDMLWWRTVARSMDMPGPSPASQLLVSINTPLALLEAFVFRHLPARWDLITFVVAIEVFWYWVGMNIVTWREQRAAYLFSWMPLRLLADVTIIGIGAFWILECCKEIYRYPDQRLFSARGWLYPLLLALPIVWGIVLVSFFGYDCIHSLVRRKSA